MTRIVSSAAWLLLGLFGCLVPPALAQEKSAKEEAKEEPSVETGEWIQLFNGKNLDGWTPKIRYSPAGENWGDTFRVEDGVLKVAYDKYDKFGERFGHLFYNEPFSNYILRIEYRFVGEQCPGGPGWAIRNSGAMLHGESPATMAVDQDFPASIEVQFLGGSGSGKRTTSNLCTPGTNVVMNGKLITQHCTSSTSETYHGDQWVTAEIEVRGNKVMRHKLGGKVVLEYNEPQLDERDAHAKELAAKAGTKQLSGGTISLQSESHPIEFRKVELKKLAD
jgi:hypothetical protein